ncbi:MAG: hypothetical protein RLN69_02320 [Woeseiaceae bacterium]
MIRTFSHLVLAVLALASASCLISMMVIFMGGGQGGIDLRGLMFLQLGLIPIALGIAIVSVYGFVSVQGWSPGLQRLWLAVPQWPVFIFLLFNSLVLLGELALIIVMLATDQALPWHVHIPLACIFVCSLAYMALHARANTYPGSPPAMSGRWM